MVNGTSLDRNGTALVQLRFFCINLQGGAWILVDIMITVRGCVDGDGGSVVPWTPERVLRYLARRLHPPPVLCRSIRIQELGDVLMPTWN